MSQYLAYQTIVTMYHGPTEHKPARISAQSTSGPARYYSRHQWDDLDNADLHREAARQYLADHGLQWGEVMITGGIKHGYVHVFPHKD